ncbi:MAG TPA: STAS/SEC14 domain-containing protein [Flavisolibacter sp.]|nr:STAS/SEC14 domain-containing protein [Flavisolibacter sp.]
MKWNKVAMVSNKESLDAMTKFFDFIVPGEAKTFSLEQLEEAKEWVSEP